MRSTQNGHGSILEDDAGKQLNIAINPDFGQVESDELVVNFGSMKPSIPTAPFFSENHSLFDVKSDEIFTSSIPGELAGDYDCIAMVQSSPKPLGTGISDIDVALRYTHGENPSISVSWRARVRR